ncbi:hypothetical protein BGW80DRAFT_1252877 [Lactifluus volemus]|nr:hypothetical protein BGW80DRAFT_1252877 [Lactifluus volemus]
MALEEAEREQREMMWTPTPDGPQPDVHPGVGWIPNEILPDWKLPNVPDGNGTSTASFVLIDMTDDDGPSVLGTQGKNCPTSCRPLRAKQARFPQRPYNRKQRFLFAEDEKHTPLVDAALEDLEDPTLKAEVIRHRLFISKMRRTARHMAHLRRKFLAYQEEAWATYEHLANANAAFRITHMINTDIGGGFGSGARLSYATRRDGMDVMEDPWMEELTRRENFCEWCRREDHDTRFCHFLPDTSKTNATSRIPIVTTDLHAKFPSTTSTSRRHAALHVLDAPSDVVTTSPKSLDANKGVMSR